MAERKKRGRYKEFLRHSNPYKFPVARRQKRIKRYLRNIDRAPPVSLDSYECDHDFQIENDVLSCHRSEPVTVCNDKHSSYEPDVTATTLSACSDSDGRYFINVQEVLDTDCKESSNRLCESASDDERSTFTDNMYARFLRDENASSDVFSDNENIESDSESLLDEACETKHDDVLYSGAPITTTSSIVLILSFVMKYNLTREALRDLLAVIEAHCPRPNNCKTEVKKLFDFVTQAKGNIVKHFFCSYCKAYSGKGTRKSDGKTEVTGTCHICGKNLAKTHGFYIEVPIVKQLQKFFEDPEFVSGLTYRFQRVKRDDGNIEDVYDGYLYQREFAPGGFLSEPYNISVKLNTDGVAIFRSSQFGVWPLFLLVNELPPAIRRKKKFRVFGGLWFGEEKPFFSTFFKPFVDSLHETEINGIEVLLPDGVKAKSKVMALSSHFDLPARAGVLEQVPYIGHDSCCFCDEHGETVKTGPRGHVMTFPFRNTATGHCKLRTAEEVTANSNEALERNTVVSGFKAPSPLLQLPSFDIVNGIGSRYVLTNQHMLLHLKKSVMDHGPLWSSSLFVFEDWNGDIGNYFHGTQSIASQIMTAVTGHQQLPQLMNEMPPGNAKDIVMRLQGQHERRNKTHLRDDFYAVGALKHSTCKTEPFEDDLQAFLGLESLLSVKYFTRLQVGTAVFHSRLYKRVSRRNTFTVAYRQKESSSINYGQIEVFFKAPVDSKISCGAVVLPLSRANQDICKQHEVLGRPVSHIITLRHPSRHFFVVVPLEDIIDICVFMAFSDSEVSYGAHFPNHFERD